MDDVIINSSMDNFLKRNSGVGFGSLIQELLEYHVTMGNIIDYTKEPKYTAPGYSKTQYNPDFEIVLNNKKVLIIDNTTTVRSDRIKQKQWDAFGVKKHFDSIGVSVKYFVVIPNSYNLGNESTNTEEFGLYLTQRLHIATNRHYSAIDDIIELYELNNIIISSI